MKKIELKECKKNLTPKEMKNLMGGSSNGNTCPTSGACGGPCGYNNAYQCQNNGKGCECSC